MRSGMEVSGSIADSIVYGWRKKKRKFQIVDGLAGSYESSAVPCQMVRWIKIR